MQKPLTLSIAVCLGLTSCQLVEKSRTWETVMSVKPGDAIRQPDPSSSYADKLHHVLLDQGVEHIVVTYQFHYYTHQYEEAVSARTAVVYRDNADSRYPWWLKDDRTTTPFWLPNGDLNKQLSFYAHRPAQVLEQKLYPARSGSSKAVVAHFRPAQVQPRDHVAQHPQPAAKIAQIKPAATPAAKPPVTVIQPAAPKPVAVKPATAKPVALRPAATPTVVPRVQHPPAAVALRPAATPAVVPHVQRPPAVVVAKPVPTGELVPIITVTATTHPNSPTAPAAIDPIAEAPEPVLRDEPLEKLFRSRTGSVYDPTSPVDRKKMEQLKRGSVEHDVSGENGLRQGVDVPVLIP